MLRDVFAGGLAESSGGFLNVKDVVGDLEGPADGLSKSAQMRDVFFSRADRESSGRDGSANQRGGF